MVLRSKLRIFISNSKTSQNLQKPTLLIKKSSKWPEKKIVLYKPFYECIRIFFFSAHFEDFFVNKLEIRTVRVIGQLPLPDVPMLPKFDILPHLGYFPEFWKETGSKPGLSLIFRTPDFGHFGTILGKTADVGSKLNPDTSITNKIKSNELCFGFQLKIT